MRTRPPTADALPLDNNPRQIPTITVVIEVDTHREPIEGRLLEPSALATPFRGWLSLAALMESTRAQPTYAHGHPLT
jgi:hypothetical protein